VLSFDEAVRTGKEFNLQKTDPTFKDTDGSYYRAFQDMPMKLDSKTSETGLCIEKFLNKSEME